MGWELVDVEVGYKRVQGSEYPGLLVVLEEVAKAERNDLLQWFASATLKGDETARWIVSHANVDREGASLSQLEGYEEILRSFLSRLTPEQRLAGLAPEQRLAGLAPEQRLAGLAPEQRVAGLAPEQRVAGLAPEQRLAGLAPEQRLADLTPDEVMLALPDEILRNLRTEYLITLKDETRAQIRQRLGLTEP